MAQFKHIKGGEELQKFLTELPVKIERNIMRSALRAGAKVFADQAKINVPVKSGDLKRSIELSTKSKNGKITAKVKAGDDIAFYAHMIEFGTAKHIVKLDDKDRPERMTRRGKKKMIGYKTINKMVNNGSLVINGKFVGDKINHPGARAKPFMRPAFDSKSSDAIRAVGLKIKERLNKQGINQAEGLEVGDE